MDDELYIAAKSNKRILAFVFDLMLNFAVAIILMIPSILALVNLLVDKNNSNVVALFIATFMSGALVLSFVVFYFVCLPVFWNGQTIGKRFFNIKIINIYTNDSPNAKTMFIREFIRILICLLTVGLSAIASIVAVCLSEKHTAFHEILSSTRVVNVNVYQNEN